MNSRITRLRIILAVLTPLMLSAIASTWLISTFTRNQLEEQASQFGQAIADQLANTSIYYLVSNDVLSLNVVLDKLLARHNFDFAAVYNPDSQLMAQSGKHTNSERSFTRDINFQDANLGYVLIELDSDLLQQRLQQILFTSLLIHSLIALLTMCFIWFYGDLAYLWVTREYQPAKLVDKSTPHHLEQPTDRCTLLVLKIKPARLVPLDGINKACVLYGGQLEIASDEEWLITFNTVEQLSRSLCCGLLIKEIAMLQTGKLHFKAGIDSASVDELPMLRKQASYLASVSEQNLVVSQRVNREIHDKSVGTIPGKIVLRQFHSSFAGDGEVYVVDSQDSLVQQQARQIKGLS